MLEAKKAVRSMKKVVAMLNMKDGKVEFSTISLESSVHFKLT